MKTTKKIFAAFLAVMMIALMIPFTASAEETTPETYTASIKGLKDYTISIYKVATLTKSSGAYSEYNSKLSDALTTPSTTGVNTQDLLDACNSLTNDELGAAVASTKFTDNETPYVFSTPNAGVYYIKWTAYKTGASVKQVTNSVLSLPYYKNGVWNNSYDAVITTKISDGTPTVTKTINNSDIDNSNTTANIGDEVTFTLDAKVVGSAEETIKSYSIIDTMSAGLDFVKVNSVKLDTATIDASNYDVVSSSQTVTISLKNTYLEKNDFYAGSDVYVEYVAKLNNNALVSTVGNLQKNTNHVDLKYKDKFNQESTINGNTINVYTFSLDVVKVDASTIDKENKIYLNDAGFTLYTNIACTNDYIATNGAEKKTADVKNEDGSVIAKGVATFTGLKAGKYYLKETTAPAGYNINSSVYEINIAKDGKVTGEIVKANQAVVPDTPLIVPQTGGMGTMMFTIGGAALIACAGVLFLIVRKKKSAK